MPKPKYTQHLMKCWTKFPYLHHSNFIDFVQSRFFACPVSTVNTLKHWPHFFEINKTIGKFSEFFSDTFSFKFEQFYQITVALLLLSLKRDVEFVCGRLLG